MNPGSVSDERVSTMPRRERDRMRRRNDILRAAEDVFASKGYHQASIEEIAGAAEYGTGTVYLYFKDKETLYIELFEQKIRELIECIRDRTDGVGKPDAALREFIQARMDYFDRNRAFFQIYVREGMNLGWSKHERWGGIHRLYDKYLEMLAQLIREGQRRRLFRKQDARLVAIALSGMMIQLTQDWLKSPVRQPLGDHVDFVVNLFLRGAGLH